MENNIPPILEFDPDTDSFLNPKKYLQSIGAKLKFPERAVLTFFNDVLEDMVGRGELEITGYLHSEIGKNPIYEFKNKQYPVMAIHAGVGAPLAGAFLEEIIALGARKVMVCGSAGTLNHNFEPGMILVPVSAIRDEGTSYHYMPPGREAKPGKRAIQAIRDTLKDSGEKYKEIKTWTTDAFYRETAKKIEARRKEGCEAVEMEASALFAVAQFREIEIGYMLYADDYLSTDSWDPRNFMDREKVRKKLFDLSLRACMRV